MKRSVRINVRATKEQVDAIKDAAARAGVNMSRYMLGKTLAAAAREVLRAK